DPFAPPVPLRSAAQLRMQYDGEQRTMSPADARRAAALSSSAAELLSGMPGGGGTGYARQAGARAPPARGHAWKKTILKGICAEARAPKRAAGPKAKTEALGSGRTLLHVFM